MMNNTIRTTKKLRAISAATPLPMGGVMSTRGSSQFFCSFVRSRTYLESLGHISSGDDR